MNNRKKVVITILALIGLAILAIYIFTASVSNNDDIPPTNGDDPVVTDFNETGNLTINNPGLDPNVWYLVYEKPSQPALTAKLEFNEYSTCIINNENRACPIGIEAGERASVIGTKVDSTVTVERLEQEVEAEPETREVLLYYYNAHKDVDAEGNILCSEKGLASTTRELPVTDTPIQDTIRLLISGNLTDEEETAGLSTEFPLPGFTLTSANLENGVLTLKFNDPQNQTSGGSCRAGILWHQIEATAKQFDNVQEVKFEPETLFQP